MKHDSVICFRLPSDLKTRLSDMAQGRKQNLSEFLKDMISAHLESKPVNEDRRAHPRKQVDLSAVVQFDASRQETHYIAGKVTDLSETGLHLVIAKDRLNDTLNQLENDFWVLFKMDEQNQAHCLRCKPCRMGLDGSHVGLGAYFVHSPEDDLKPFRSNFQTVPSLS